MKRTLEQEQINKVIDALENQYGEQGEDFEVKKVKVKGSEYLIAVKSPTRAQLNSFKSAASNAKSETDKLKAAENLVIDTIISDVEGCENLESYRKLLEAKPQLSDHLANEVAVMSNSGIASVKKV